MELECVRNANDRLMQLQPRLEVFRTRHQGIPTIKLRTSIEREEDVPIGPIDRAS
jgi:hypothetical protein